MKPLFLILLALPLCGCDLNALTGEPSEFQKYQERIYHQRISALETQVASLSAPVVASAAPVKVAEVKPEPPEPPPLPPCTVTFRVNRCGPNNEVLPW